VTNDALLSLDNRKSVAGLSHARRGKGVKVVAVSERPRGGGLPCESHQGPRSSRVLDR